MKRHRRSIHRIIVRVSIFLLLGAIVNVAVAWGCATILEGQTGNWSSMRVGVDRLENGGVWSVYRLDRPGHTTIESVVEDYTIEQWHERWEEPGSLIERWSRTPSQSDLSGRLVRWEESASGWPVTSMWSRLDLDDPLHDVTLPNNPRVLPRDNLERGWLLDWGFLSTEYILPIGLIWPGFAVNTIFYALLLWPLLAAPGFVRRRRRLKRGLCPTCAYPIGTSDVCTECGKELPERSTASGTGEA